MANFQVAETDVIAIEAGADLRNNLGYAVKLDANGNVVLAGDGEAAIGVIYEVNLQGSAPYGPVTVQYRGIAKMVAGSSIAPGNPVQANAAGKARNGSTNRLGYALEGAAGDGSKIPVLLTR